MTVVNVEHFVFDSADGSRSQRFLGADAGEFRTAQLVVSGVAIRHADEAHDVPSLAIQGCRTRRLVFAIVGVSSDDEDSQRGRSWLGHGVRLLQDLPGNVELIPLR